MKKINIKLLSMKNLSISQKLLVGFGFILVLLLITIGAAIISINGINQEIETYSNYTLPNSTSIWRIRHYFVSIQRDIASALGESNAFVGVGHFDKAKLEATLLLDELEKYANNQRDTSRDEQLIQVNEYIQKAAGIRLEIAELMRNPTELNVLTAKDSFKSRYMPLVDKATDILIEFSDESEKRAYNRSLTPDRQLNPPGLSSHPVLSWLSFNSPDDNTDQKIDPHPVKNNGGIRGNRQGNLQSQIDYEGSDEMGKMANLIQNSNNLLSTMLEDVIDKFTKISKGDLQVQVDLNYPGDFQALNWQWKRWSPP